MPLTFSPGQLKAFDQVVVDTMSRRLATTLQTLRPDLCKATAAQNGCSESDMVRRICHVAYDIGLSRAGDLAAYAALRFGEVGFGPEIPQFYAFLQSVASYDTSGRLRLQLAENRLEFEARSTQAARDLAAFAAAAREAI